MGTETEAFTPEIYAQIRAGAQRSASIVVPLLVDQLDGAIGDHTALDVGCGEGWWGAALEPYGFTVTGLDANANAAIPVIDCDLEQPLPQHDRVGVVLCLEVAEHLSPARAKSFVADLCRLSDLVVFSAAIPGQGGTGHLNEQWPRYWTDLFAAHHYTCSGALRWMIWTDDRVENWYRQNLLVASRRPGLLPALFDTPLAPVFEVVHPVLYDARRP